MADSPGSSLSSLSSEDFTEDLKIEDQDHDSSALPEHGLDTPIMPPSKRQRIGSSWERRDSLSHTQFNNDHDTETDISSDTSGDVPGSPLNGLSQLQDEEAMGHEQITVCRWEGCSMGDLGNMDSLVAHIHDDHIGSRQKKYACEWDDCSRKGMPHASGYALRAHMRSHTREKPFYCQLPECDRSFTRSDALAKHMRTVHETEALRPSDPVPKHHTNPPNRFQRLKLILSAKPPDHRQHNGEEVEFDDDTTIQASTDVDAEGHHLPTFEYPADVQFTDEELALPPDQLFRLLRRQIHWAEEEGEELKVEVNALEGRRKDEWQAKELVLANVMEAEMAHAMAHAMNKGEIPREEDFKLEDDLPHPRLPLKGVQPWYRIPKEEMMEERLPPLSH
ncbi:MAG: hypothetical protein M1827_003249 [Pycnora praestabilis]|nr:MAG: hypothetical protein M1827_003249 [Pycnora praestabilis]